jgi:hypothetical protein
VVIIRNVCADLVEVGIPLIAMDSAIVILVSKVAQKLKEGLVFGDLAGDDFRVDRRSVGSLEIGSLN